MLVDRSTPEDVFVRVPQVVVQTDPVLKRLDHLWEDDQLYQQVRADLGKRYRLTSVHGRHSTPVEVILRMLLCKHLDLAGVFLQRGFVFTYESVRDWDARFALLLAEGLRIKRRGQVGTSWHVDEMYSRFHGKWCYL